jgi:two-component system, NarL family, sensor histidine kinase ComP
MIIQSSLKSLRSKIMISKKIIFLLFSLFINIWTIYVLIQPNTIQYFPNTPEMPWDLVPLIVALGFLAVGVTTLFDNAPISATAFFSFGSVIFTAGLLSGLGSPPGKFLFYLVLAWMAPIIFQFIYTWSSIHNDLIKKILLYTLFGISGFWSILLFLSPLQYFQKNQIASLISLGVRVEFILAVFFVIIYFFLHNMGKKRNDSEKRHLRLIFFGVVLAFLPIILFSLIPYLLGFTFVRTEALFFFLLFIPLTYGSSTSTSRYQILHKVFNRAIYYYLTIVLVGSAFLFLGEILIRLFPTWKFIWAWVVSAICIFFVFILNRIDQVVEKLVYWVLNGNEKRYLDLVIKMSDALGLVHNREVFNKILVDDLVEIMQLSGCALFLKTEEGINLVKSKGCLFTDQEIHIQENCDLIDYLKTSKKITDDHTLHKKIRSFPQNLETIFQSGNVIFWIPLISGEELYGLLVIGHFPHDYLLSKNEWQALQVLAHQAGVASHNVQLMEELQKKTSELAYAHQRLLFAHERESRQISNKLHDNFIQELLGISYQLADLKENVQTESDQDQTREEMFVSTLDSIRGQVLQTTSELRNVVGELRPAGLEEFGLCKALEGYIYKIRNNPGFKVPQFVVSLPENDLNLGDEISICLFRVAQEAIRNSVQHAKAKTVEVCILLTDTTIVLRVMDDGCGFLVPKWKDEITETNHFGILGMSERISWVGGQISIISSVGKGTKIIATVPLEPHKLKNGGNID